MTPAAGVAVLAVNAGSSSVKLALFRVGPTGEAECWRSQVDGPAGSAPDLAGVATQLDHLGLPRPTAVGHRVVHGGSAHTRPEVVDDDVLAQLEALVPFAPLHQPAALAGIRAARRAWPDLVQVACFDTAFHRTLAPDAYTLALPPSVRDAGVRRYGFHGLSYEYVVGHLADEQPGRTVIAHLGSGASLCAVADGRSVDTTMGFTPTGGVVMGTRPGDLDPGVLVHLLRHPPPDMTPDADGLEDLLDRRSGLLGLSGRSNDVRTLLEARAAGDEASALALAVFARTAAKQVAALATAVGGLDTLVFTAGIGERSAEVRAEICAPLAFLGIEIDADANRVGADVISTPGGVTVRVVPTDEERMIARHTATVVAAATG